jgi:hypothetical protein
VIRGFVADIPRHGMSHEPCIFGYAAFCFSIETGDI